MMSAVNNWEDKTGEALDSNGEELRLRAYSNVVGIPYDTFKKFVPANQEKRREVGKSVGKAPLLKKEDQNFLAELFVRKDHANDGAKLKEAIDMVQDLDKTLSWLQATQHLQPTLIPNFAPLLKQKPVAAQATTTKRSDITVVQQFRWHTAYGGALNELRQRNTGSCNLTGKSFGELIHCFISGGDETCLMASDDGTVRIIGGVGRKKHETKSADSRLSISMYRTGAVAGDTGPTVFLLQGKNKRAYFTDAFLREHGAAEGSTIVMTPTAFMTTESWEEMTPSIIKGLRAISAIVKANPQWWMLEIFDGFGAHLASLPALRLRYESKILCLKEEGDSSHVNQA